MWLFLLAQGGSVGDTGNWPVSTEYYTSIFIYTVVRAQPLDSIEAVAFVDNIVVYLSVGNKYIKSGFGGICGRRLQQALVDSGDILFSSTTLSKTAISFHL